MKNYLQKLYEKYPKSQIEDFIKHLYIGYLGPGHFITNKQQSLDRLKKEAHNLTNFHHENLYDYVLENYVRVNLRPYIEFKLSLEALNDFFVESSKKEVDFPSFLKSLEVLKKFLLEEGFNKENIEKIFQDYHQNNYPHPSHSEIYQSIYQTAYRIIHKDYLSEELKFYQVKHYLSRFNKDKINIIAIDGKCTSGKTTISKLIQKECQATIIQVDDFFDNADSIIGINSERLINEVLTKLNLNTDLTYNKYDCSNKTFIKNTIPVNSIVIIEGVYSANQLLQPYLDGIIYLDINNEEQMIRLNNRSKALLNRFINEWIPRENQYFDKENIRYQADIIV